MQDQMSPDRSAEVVSTLHAILKPFLLRRLKADVADLPPKKEYVLYAPLTKGQKEIYEQIVSGDIREYLTRESGKDKDVVKVNVDVDAPRQTRGAGNATRYDLDGDDDEYFDRLEAGSPRKVTPNSKAVDLHDIARDYQHKATRKSLTHSVQWYSMLNMALVKQVNNMKLQNKIMQLRKICSHP